ncbi:glycosyltransferase family 4 protein [Azotobacter beijerinckii]|uniref:Alpha-1,3-rhamnosyl/mannosyltransferase n=1 Tax=Azotobacter beijerinckii TaxID=170623 RepID=A0A1I3ZV37_9GAMM|nr:glycosyltransferase family 1 protein [Azotobacter beijerinckii]SFA85315.1 alpha-1,3-rhamnosyl/mannosyltransferase [Azotobacter beijerinckii]SFK47797.1 alpha-1,3-rhamnosyl/mannosyltransferase [Azotobacter beijerinckii]
MKLLLNTESLVPPLTGIGNYTLNLLRELQAFAAIEQIDCFTGNRLVTAAEVLAASDDEAAGEGRGALGDTPSMRLRKLIRGLPLAYRAHTALRNARFRLATRASRGFVYHEPNFILKDHEGPCVATIHDLSFMRFPQFHPAERVAWLDRELPRTLRRADFIVTPSELVRHELIEQFGVPAERVRATHLGADARFFPRTAEQTQAVLARHGLQHGRYVAFVGTIEPRKGVDQLLAAWMQLPVSLRRTYPLVVAGASGWRNDELMAHIQTLQASGEIRYLRYIGAADLPFLYSGAVAFVYPSLYEGFGLPVLEAMASGTPVICTAGTSMAEFAGEVAMLCEANDTAGLAATLHELLEDESLRERLIRRGLEQARLFSWTRCARETLEVYSRVT